MPDDGNRYELIGGETVVIPSPMPRHQVIVSRLSRVLAASAPEHLEVVGAPLETVLEVDSVVQPDLLVCPDETWPGRTPFAVSVTPSDLVRGL